MKVFSGYLCGIVISLSFIVWSQYHTIDSFKRRVEYLREDKENCIRTICSDHKSFDTCNGQRCILVTPGEYPDYACYHCKEYTCKE